MPAPPLTTNRPYFIGSEETGNMNPTKSSPLSKNSYQKTDRPCIAQASGSTAATEIFSVPVKTRKSVDTNRSKYVAPGAIPDQQNVLTTNFQNTTLGRQHFYNATDAGRNPENLVNNKVTTLQPSQPSMVTTRIQANIRTTRTTINTSPSFEITTARSNSQTFA